MRFHREIEMGVYHQMGHDSWNLVSEKALHGYDGIVLSPVNDPPGAIELRLQKLGKLRNKIEVILDPQFYKPSSDRGHLAAWGHFSDDVDTVNLSDISWWEKRGQALVEVASTIGADSICSPAMLARTFNDEYYRWTVECANRLSKHASDIAQDVLLTALVRLPELAQKGRPEAIASILTSTDISRIYLVISDDLGPRDQRVDVEGLAGTVRLIKLLEDAGTKVLVAFSGLDMLIWKAAGASAAATGKFFNLRRFVPGRWDDASEGGRVVPYWTDEHLVTWLREADVRLLDREGLIDRSGASKNPYSAEILGIIDAGMGEAWVGLGWRQYLYWFKEIEAVLAADPSAAESILTAADHRWGAVAKSRVLLLDRENTGDWIRSWLNAIRLGLK